MGRAKITSISTARPEIPGQPSFPPSHLNPLYGLTSQLCHYSDCSALSSLAVVDAPLSPTFLTVIYRVSRSPFEQQSSMPETRYISVQRFIFNCGDFLRDYFSFFLGRGEGKFFVQPFDSIRRKLFLSLKKRGRGRGGDSFGNFEAVDSSRKFFRSGFFLLIRRHCGRMEKDELRRFFCRGISEFI